MLKGQKILSWLMLFLMISACNCSLNSEDRKLLANTKEAAEDAKRLANQALLEAKIASELSVKSAESVRLSR